MTPFWRGYVHERVSRRRALRAGMVTAVAAAALPLVGCDLPGGGSSDEPDAPGTPRRGGTLRFGSTVPLSYGLDPHLEQGGGLPVIARLYGYPFHIDADNADALSLDQAASVEQPARDIYVVRVGEHRFHESSAAAGRQLLSHDMVYSMRRYRDHPLVLNRWWHKNMLAGEGGSDERTVVIRTHRPYVYSLAELGDINGGALIAGEAVEGRFDLRTIDAGSGPMQLREAALPDRVVLARHESYAREPSYVDAMEFRTFGSDDEMLALFRTRALDVVALRTYQQYEDLVDRKHVHGGRENGASWTSIGVRVDRAPFSDERVRRAVDLGIDRGALNEHVAQGQALLAGPVAPRLGGGDWALSQDELATLYQSSLTREERLQEARTLLDAAGTTDVRFAMQVSDDPGLTDLASLVQAQLAKAGMQVSIDRLPLLRWYVNYRRGDFDATLISHPPFATPDGSLRLYHSSGGGGEANPFGFADSAIDALIERTWSEDDRDARRETVREAQRLMIEARPMIHLIATNGYAAAHSYVGDSGLELPASLSRYHYRQWLGLPVDGRPA